MINITDLYAAGIAAKRQEHQTGEQEKQGTLRAGMTGCIIHGEHILGTCPKKAYLRMVGIELDDYAEDRELMFAAGHSNEDIWADILLASKQPGVSLKRESEIPIEWQLDSGRRITGRPDIVVLENGEPKLLVELKLVSSLWTGRDVGIGLSPKTSHLLQAGHYAWQLDLPGEIWYTSRADYAIGGWATKHFPPNSNRIEYSGDGSAKKLIPFKQGFEIEWTKKGQLIWRPVGQDGQWNHTLITQDGIRKFYELVDQMPTLSKLPGCVSSLEANGERMSYDLSNYCPLNALGQKCAHAGHKQSFAEWMESVHAHVANTTAGTKETQS